jgi:hypothetical protein
MVGGKFQNTFILNVGIYLPKYTGFLIPGACHFRSLRHGTSAALYITFKCWNVLETCLRVRLRALRRIGVSAYLRLYNIEATLKLYVCQNANWTGRQIDNKITN